MGQNKLLKKWNGRTIFQVTLEEVLACGLEEIIVVTGNDEGELLQIINSNDYPLQTIFNSEFSKGMTTSIQAGVKAASPDTHGFMICLADMPRLRTEDYKVLLSHFVNSCHPGEKCIIVPEVVGRRKNPVIFSKEFKDDILTHNNMDGCREIIRDNSPFTHAVTFNDIRPFSDIDTPEDFRELEGEC